MTATRNSTACVRSCALRRGGSMRRPPRRRRICCRIGPIPSIPVPRPTKSTDGVACQEPGAGSGARGRG